MNEFIRLLKRKITYYFNRKKGIPFCPHCGSPYTSYLQIEKGHIRHCSECGLVYSATR